MTITSAAPTGWPVRFGPSSTAGETASRRVSHGLIGGLNRPVGQALRLPGLLWREARPAVQLVFALRLVVGATVAVGPAAITRPRTLILLVSWMALTLAVYVFNGLTDVAGDRRNGSGRPLASGRLDPLTAGVATAVIALAGLLGCGLDDPLSLVPAVLFLVLGWTYSAGPGLKARPCGFAVVIGVGAALTYAAGWSLDPVRPAGLAAEAAIAAWVGVCCAAKDFSDVDGDRAAGRRSWPVVLGPERAALVLAACAVGTAVLAVGCGVLDRAMLPAALVLLAGSGVLAIELRRCVRTPALACIPTDLLGWAPAAGVGTDRATRRRPYRAFLATQYTANAVILSGLVTLLTP